MIDSVTASLLALDVAHARRSLCLLLRAHLARVLLLVLADGVQLPPEVLVQAGHEAAAGVLAARPQLPLQVRLQRRLSAGGGTSSTGVVTCTSQT